MRLGSGLDDHLRFARWVRSAGGEVKMESGEFQIIGPSKEEVIVREGIEITWDGQRFSPVVDRE